MRTLLVDRRWLLFLALSLAGGFALAANNTYFFPYLKELGAAEAVDHGITGLVVDADSAGPIAQAALSILGDRAFITRARDAGHCFVEERFGLFVA